MCACVVWSPGVSPKYCSRSLHGTVLDSGQSKVEGPYMALSETVVSPK
jgi:hypothetical protein